MRQTVPLTNLINDLVGDLRDPGLMWQLAAIVLSIFLGWTLSRYLHKRYRQRHAETTARGVARFGFESFGRVVGPLTVVCLLGVSQAVLTKWHHVNLIKVALPIFGSLAVIRLAFYLLRRVFARGGEMGQTLLTFEKIFQLLVWLGFVLYITGLWDDIFLFLDDTYVPLGKNHVSLTAILQAAVSVVVLLIVAMWAGAALEERLMHLQSVNSNLRVALARVGRSVLIVAAVLISLSQMGMDLTALSVFGGALGVGLGLGLQKIASNYVSGFIILLDRSLSIGDVITVDKYSGQVTQINTRYTVLLSGDGVESIVPNEMLISSPVQNSSLTNRWVAVTAKVSVAYDSDVDQVLKLLEEAALKVERVSKEKLPGATMQSFGADGIDLAVTFWIYDPENGKGGVTSDVNRAIWKSLKENGISVPFPQREVRVVGTLPGPVA
jgi:small-conductance mechanosensitive channel